MPDCHPLDGPAPRWSCKLPLSVCRALVAFALLPGSRAAADGPKQSAPAATLLTETGSVLTRAGVGKPWRFLGKDQPVPTKDLLIGLPGAVVASKNGAVRLALLSDLGELSPYPVRETAVVLHPAGDADLDFTLDRGRVDLTNARKKGAAQVRVRFRDQVWDLTLDGPGTRVALEIYGRWPPGSRFNPRPKAGAGPLTNVVLLVLKGDVERRDARTQHALSAPPGPALFHWDSVNGPDRAAQKLDALPPWAVEPAKETPLVRKKKQQIAKFIEAVRTESLDTVLKRVMASEDADVRRLGLNAAAALDELALVGEVLTTSKQPADWHNAVVALRHWIGRAPGQDVLLYEALKKQRHFTAAEARIVLDLLHGVSEREASRPELYQALILLLGHKRMAIRGLANWHLQRLAPGVKIAFNPAGDEKERQRAQAAWRKALPPGKLPPEPATPGKGKD